MFAYAAAEKRHAAAGRHQDPGPFADQMGYSHRDLARRAVERALPETLREPAEEVRHLELARLDEMSRRAWAILDSKHLVVTPGGKAVRHPETGEWLTDPHPVPFAIETLLRISDRRAKLLGLDAPRQVVLTMEAIDAEIARLVAELAASDPRALPPGVIEGEAED